MEELIKHAVIDKVAGKEDWMKDIEKEVTAIKLQAAKQLREIKKIADKLHVPEVSEYLDKEIIALIHEEDLGRGSTDDSSSLSQGEDADQGEVSPG